MSLPVKKRRKKEKEKRREEGGREGKKEGKEGRILDTPRPLPLLPMVTSRQALCE
jgi:hypothetical protein